MKVTVEERFWAKVNKDEAGGCWVWTAGTFRLGYGQFFDGEKKISAHRFAWIAHSGEAIPAGFHVCHHCDNPPCCNPSHLFLGTRSDNMRDSFVKHRGWTANFPLNKAGEKNGRAKLTEADVRKIRLRYEKGLSQPSLAVEFGVSRSMVGQIVRGTAWAHCA